MKYSGASSERLLNSALTLLASELLKRKPEEQAKILNSVLRTKSTDRDKDIARKRNERSESARIEIPECKNPARRADCLADPEKFLKTYFAAQYGLPFGKHHRFMIESIINRAKYGGRQAIAAPRGCGKSELVKGLMVYLVLAGLVRFPLPIAATTDLACRLYKDFQKKIATNQLLADDFPEVCYPVRALEGAPQRAAKQHVDGKLTGIVWTGDYLRLADVPGSPYGGVKMAYYGLDAAFRGANIDGDRPDFILIDDPETRESAKSRQQIADREAILDQDISGLVSQEDNLAIVVLTTVQNCYCMSYHLTDRKERPSYNGVRFGIIEKWPDNMELWQEYIGLRHSEQAAGDEHARKAVQFYLDNWEAMNAGVEMLTDSFVHIELEDGTQLVHSALQQAFNKIADTSFEAFKTEYQNDPEQEEQSDSSGLTAAVVASRQSGFDQNKVPELSQFVTVGLDMGKNYCHWAKTAWWGNAIGTVIDYGVLEVNGVHPTSTPEAIEKAQLAALYAFRTEVEASEKVDAVMIDAGTFTQTVYSFVRSVGSPYFATKGWDHKRFRMPIERTVDKLPFIECWAHNLKEEAVWLYNVNTEWWKDWLQQRFLTPTFDESHRFQDGSLSVYSHPDKRRHTSFAHHIVSEERRTIFVEGRGNVTTWEVLSKNNHWLDATALACAGAGCLGVRLLPKLPPKVMAVTPTAAKQEQSRFVTPSGKPYLVTER